MTLVNEKQTTTTGKKIPTNIITGFLGVGKTTLIQHLLKHKPENEVWGILVNEFGQVGIDGSMLDAHLSKEGIASGVVIKEVPGGCLCCVAGLPMKMGLNMLISKSKPDRILIEPTGLGHLQQVIDDLTGEFYCDVLALNATVCIINPRHLADEKYTTNQYFQDQLSLADVVVANKTEQLSSLVEQDFMHFTQALQPKKSAIEWTVQGHVDLDILGFNLDHSRTSQHLHVHLAHTHHHELATQQDDNIDDRFERKHGSGQGMFTFGWVFNSKQTFDLMKLAHLLEPLNVERLKASIVTNQGAFIINSIDGDCQFSPANGLNESRIELICLQPIDSDKFELDMLDCLI